MTLPTFIVVGAAKAGTTALYWYLAEHPEIAMSSLKETNYFAFGVDDDGRLLYGEPELHHFPVRSRAEYERLFAHAGDATAIGEASPIYLECPQAAARIRDAIPNVHIVCGLRDPVDRAYSDYLMYLRKRGLRFDPTRDLDASAAWARTDSHWMRISRYHEALSRYYDTFRRDRIHVYLFDDLKQDTVAVVQQIYRFVGVDPSIVPDMSTPYNVGGLPANMSVERLFTNKTIKRMEPWIPRRAVDAFRRLRTRNLRKAPPLDPALRSELIEHFRDDIVRTSQLTGIDLDRWLSRMQSESSRDAER